MSQKIYFIKRNDLFLNAHGRELSFHKNIISATYMSKKDADKFVELLGDKISIHETTEQEFTNLILSTTTGIVIKLDSLENELTQLRYNLPTMTNLNVGLRRFLKNTSDKLKEANPTFKNFVDKAEDATFDAIGGYDNFINEVSAVPLFSSSEVAAIFNAYKSDPGAILGVAKKILKKAK